MALQDPLMRIGIRASLQSTWEEYRRKESELRESAGRIIDNPAEKLELLREAERYKRLADEIHARRVNYRQRHGLPPIDDRTGFQIIRNSFIEQNRNAVAANRPNESNKIPESKPLSIPKKLPDDIPSEFICPITTEIMSDPVMLTDGQVYEKKAIQKWLVAHNTSPLTKIIVDKNILIPCFPLRTLIQKFIDENKDKKTVEKKQKIKREPTAYNIFVKEKMPIFKQEHPDKPAKELMKLIGEEWKKNKI
jgi:hypothetical protein